MNESVVQREPKQQSIPMLDAESHNNKQLVTDMVDMMNAYL